MQLNKQISLSPYTLYIASCFFLLSSCEPKVDIPEPSTGNADFSRYVAIGSSYSSGFADGALSKQGQLASFPNLLAQQMKLVGGAETFNIPLLKGNKGTVPSDEYAPGLFYLTESRFILEKGPDCKGEVEILPERLDTIGDNELDISDPSQNIYYTGAVFHHLGIPVMKVIHFTSIGYGDVSNYGTDKSFSPYFWRFRPEPEFLSSPSSYVDTFGITNNGSVNPTFFTVELGMSDVLSYAIEGGIGNINSNDEDDITSVARFRNDFTDILNNLVALGAEGIVSNIPDVTNFPYFTTIEYDALELDAVEADSMNKLYPGLGYTFHEGENNPFVISEDGGVRIIKSNEFVVLGVDVDSLKCMNLGSYVPIGDEYILSEAEISNVKSFTSDYNMVIQALCEARGLPVVDLAGFMSNIYNETTIDGIDFTSEFGSGGFFSLDGLHPNDRGQALIANEFIKVINQKFGAKLPLLNITEYRGVLFP